MPNSDNENENVNGSLPTAAESIDQPTDSPEVKLYEVQVAANSQMSLTGYATVYAADPDEAVKKVKALINAEALDDDLEMEDYESRCIMPYSDVKNLFNVDFRVEAEGVEEIVDPTDVLHEGGDEQAA